MAKKTQVTKEVMLVLATKSVVKGPGQDVESVGQAGEEAIK